MLSDERVTVQMQGILSRISMGTIKKRYILIRVAYISSLGAEMYY